jgi:hypothetical protein
MEHSLEKASKLDTEHMAVLNDAFRSTSQDAGQQVAPMRLRTSYRTPTAPACLQFTRTH